MQAAGSLDAVTESTQTVRKGSKPEHNAKGKARIVLRFAKKTGVNVMQLCPQGYGREQRVIHAAAEPGCQGEIGVGNTAAFVRLVAHAQQELGKRPILAITHRSARAKQQRVAAGVQPEPGARAANDAAGCVVSPVVPVEVRHYAQPRQVFALNRSLPSAHVGRAAAGLNGATVREGFAVNIRVTEKCIASGGKLGAGYS